jgi:hypothetical protein
MAFMVSPLGSCEEGWVKIDGLNFMDFENQDKQAGV